jgi:hypothetical protein
MLLWVALTTIGAVAGDAPTLEITEDPPGGFRAKAVLHIPASPEAVHAVLTDYDAWPALFGGRFRITHVQHEPGRVVTDLLIKRTPLPGEMRLLCETQELPDGVLVTSLMEGDFTRYVRRWKLDPEPNGVAPHTQLGTQAQMDLSMELKTWVPDWIVRAHLRRQLLEHFRILREKAIQKQNER